MSGPNIIAGLLLSVIGWSLVRLIRVIQYLLKASRSYYRITGIWIGPCKLPRYPPNVEAVEIIA